LFGGYGLALAALALVVLALMTATRPIHTEDLGQGVHLGFCKKCHPGKSGTHLGLGKGVDEVAKIN